MTLRRLLLRILLASVCFHAVLGVPLHEAGHLREALATPLLAHGSDAFDTGAEAGHGDDHDESHGSGTVCAWSIAHAVLAGPTGDSSPMPEPLAEPTRQAPQRCIGAPTGEGRWPFAARDPPRSLTT